MDKRGIFPIHTLLIVLGNIIPAANRPRSQYEEFKERQIDEPIAFKRNAQGILII